MRLALPLVAAALLLVATPPTAQSRPSPLVTLTVEGCPCGPGDTVTITVSMIGPSLSTRVLLRVVAYAPPREGEVGGRTVIILEGEELRLSAFGPTIRIFEGRVPADAAIGTYQLEAVLVDPDSLATYARHGARLRVRE